MRKASQEPRGLLVLKARRASKVCPVNKGKQELRVLRDLKVRRVSRVRRGTRVMPGRLALRGRLEHPERQGHLEWLPSDPSLLMDWSAAMARRFWYPCSVHQAVQLTAQNVPQRPP